MAHPIYNQNLGLIGILAQNTGEDPLAGTWVFNDTLDFSSLGLSQDDGIYWSVNFTMFSGIALNAISIGYNSSGYYVEYKEVTGGFPTPYPAYYSYDETGLIGWQGEDYKTITITSKLSEVTNGDSLLAWLQANATKQGTSTPTLISFTIAGTTYQAEESMTWKQWVASSYNTGGFYIIAGNTRVMFSNGTDYVSSEGFAGDYANNTSQIVANGTYYKFSSGGGGN